MLILGLINYLNLAFYWFKLLLWFLLPLIGFVIRRKWRLAIARKEEVKRLLILASEETARAELELVSSSSSYNRNYDDTVSWRAPLPIPATTPTPVAPLIIPFQCAVCYLPTKKLCARCKSVRYCSGKCQITHWREGHKEECRPCTTAHQIVDEGNTSSWKTEKKEQSEHYNNSSETEDGHAAKPAKTLLQEYASSNERPSSEVLRWKDSEFKDVFHGDVKEANFSSKSSSTSFSSEFSSSAASSESSDDASLSESIDSNDLGKSDGQKLAEIAPDKLETSVKVNIVDRAKLLSAEVNGFDDVVHSFTSPCKLNEIKPSSSDGETQQGSTSSSDLDINDSGNCSVPKHPSATNEFWENALDYSWSRNVSRNGSTKSNSSASVDGDASNSGSTLQFSFNISGNTVSPLLSEDSELTDSTDGGAFKGIDGGISKADNSPSLNTEKSNLMKDDITSSSGFKGVKSCSSSASSALLSCSVEKEHSTVESINISSSSLRSERLSNVVNVSDSVSNKLRSRAVGSLSSTASFTHSSSRNGGQSASSVQSAKADGVNANGVMSSHSGSLPHNSNNGLKTSVKKVVDQFKAAKLSKHCSLASGTESTVRSNNKGLFSYELFVKLYMWNKVELRPCGLINCGNSCYANVVLQCLAFTPPLTAYFLQGLHREACAKKDWCLTCEFESLILKAKEGNSPLSPSGIISQLSNIGSHLSNGREEDAHEFLRYVIDTMQSICLKESTVNVSAAVQEETTLIGLTFGGYLRSKIKCLKCNGKSERNDRIMDLAVEIEGDIGTLEDALNQFTKTEILDGENKYECSRCKSYQKAKKKLTILEAPNVLTIALKRFQSGKFGKLNKSIEFPEILDLAQYMSSTTDKSPIYRLYGVVVHLDIMNAAFSGHYVCYVKNIQNKWYKIDDSTVKPVELKNVKEKAAYMLLYARCSPRAPRSLRSKLSRDPKPKIASSRSKSPSAIPSLIPLDLPGFENHTRHHAMHTICETDSSSSSESLFSSCSDEGSWSTESSTRDSSTSADDLPDFRFGGTGSPWRNSSDSDSPSSSSPLYPRYPREEGWIKEGKGGIQFLHSDSTKLCRNSNSFSERQRLGFNDVQYGVSCRTSCTREKSG